MSSSPDSMRKHAMELRRQADELERLAAAIEASPNLPTATAKSILSRAGFRVIHAETLRDVKEIVEQVKEKDLGGFGTPSHLEQLSTRLSEA